MTTQLPDYISVAKMIDHALLAPTLTLPELEAGVEMARAYNVASVCIMPHAVPLAARLLKDSSVLTSTVIGFPHGVTSSAAKVAEAEQALLDGAQELDMVANVSRLKSGDLDYVKADVAGVLKRVRAHGAKLKLIFETAFLDRAEKIALCQISAELGVDWVKTSTGFASGGSTPEDLKLMRDNSPDSVQLKASGGIRTLDDLLEARTLGATRVGASKTSAILNELRQRLGLAPLEVPEHSTNSSY